MTDAVAHDPVRLRRSSWRWLLGALCGLSMTVLVGGMALIGQWQVIASTRADAHSARERAVQNAERILRLEELDNARAEQIRALGAEPVTLPTTTTTTRAAAARTPTTLRPGATTTTARSAATTAPNPSTTTSPPVPSPTTTVKPCAIHPVATLPGDGCAVP